MLVSRPSLRQRHLLVPRVLALVVALLGTLSITQAPATAATVFKLSPTGSGDCRSSPCKDINKALGLARSGDTIELASGTYTNLRTTAQPHLGSIGTNVVIKPAPGASPVLVGSTDIYAPHLTLRGLTVRGNFVFRHSSHHGRLENATVTRGSVRIAETSDITVTDSSITDGVNADLLTIGRGAARVLITRNLIGNAVDTTGDKRIHLDCLQMFQGFSDVTIRENVLWGCGLSTLMINVSGSPARNILVERNVLAACSPRTSGCYSPYAVQIGGPQSLAASSITLRQNRIVGGIWLPNAPRGVTLTNNAIERSLSWKALVGCPNVTVTNNQIENFERCSQNLGSSNRIGPVTNPLHGRLLNSRAPVSLAELASVLPPG